MSLMVRCLPTSGRGCGSGGVAAAGEITSIYATHVGTISLTWSGTSLGLFLLTDLRLAPAPLSEADNDSAGTDDFRLRLRPFLPWRRKGSKRRDFTINGGGLRVVELAWDLTLATFRDRGPEPSAGYFVSVSVDGEVALVVGNPKEDASRGGKRSRPEMISRMERARFGEIRGELSYVTKALFEGKETAISITVDLEDEEMALEIDGDTALEVDRLRWKFRGSDWVGLKRGGRVQVSWDLNDWFFGLQAGLARSEAALGRAGDAVFVFQFEMCDDGDGEACCLKRADCNDSSSTSWTTSISSGGSIDELDSSEEAEPWSADSRRFTLLVSGWKS